MTSLPTLLTLLVLVVAAASAGSGVSRTEGATDELPTAPTLQQVGSGNEASPAVSGNPDDVGESSATDRPRPPHPLERTVVDFTLDNGWRFLLVPRPGAPRIAFETRIDVGSVDDTDGARGLAHLFAHLSLQGSERVGSLDWSEERVTLATLEELHRKWRVALAEGSDQALRAEQAFTEARARARVLVSPESARRFLEDAGGAATLRVECAADWTRYAVTLPSNQVELWAWLEAERFTRPCLRGFFDERDRWVDARRSDLTSAPRRTLREQLRLSAFTTHPYRHPAAGYVDDLTALRRSDAEDFFREHYGAARLVTSVVGAFEVEALRPLIERAFRDVPQNGNATDTPAPPTPESQATLERRIQVPYPAPPLLAMAWSVPPHAHPDSPALEVAARLLGPAPGSRLHRRLVRRGSLASDLRVDAGWPGERFDHLLLVECTPLVGTSPATVESAVLEEVAELATNGPTSEELLAAKASLVAEREAALRDPAELARLLCHYQLLTGSWQDALRHRERWEDVSAEQVRAALATYFTDVRRTTAALRTTPRVPQGSAEADEAPGDEAGASGTGETGDSGPGDADPDGIGSGSTGPDGSEANGSAPGAEDAQPEDAGVDEEER